MNMSVLQRLLCGVTGLDMMCCERQSHCQTYTSRPLIHHWMGNNDQRRFTSHWISDIAKSSSPFGQPGLSEKKKKKQAHLVPSYELMSHFSS
jgi:hypothetical protein